MKPKTVPKKTLKKTASQKNVAQRPVPQKSLNWYRYRMFSGAVFGIAGIVIAVELAMKPAPIASKVAGYGFVLVALALSAQRISAFLKARAESR